VISGVVARPLDLASDRLYLKRCLRSGVDASRAPGDAEGDGHQWGCSARALPWGLVLVGVFVSSPGACGITQLTFAVGRIMPIATTAPIFAGEWSAGGWSADGARRFTQEARVGNVFRSGLFGGGVNHRRHRLSHCWGTGTRAVPGDRRRGATVQRKARALPSGERLLLPRLGPARSSPQGRTATHMRATEAFGGG